MAQIKAAFFDIDGTLLPFHAKALPESTVRALAALRENGVKTFIATGRPPVHLPYLHALDGKLPLPEGWKIFIIQTVGLLK